MVSHCRLQARQKRTGTPAVSQDAFFAALMWPTDFIT
jgi:hypothetical protein